MVWEYFEFFHLNVHTCYTVNRKKAHRTPSKMSTDHSGEVGPAQPSGRPVCKAVHRHPNLTPDAQARVLARRYGGQAAATA
jgi:hypothetical protein